MYFFLLAAVMAVSGMAFCVLFYSLPPNSRGTGPVYVGQGQGNGVQANPTADPTLQPKPWLAPPAG